MTKYTLQQIKSMNQENGGYFFSRKTMKFFGDRMSSFNVKQWHGLTVLYRKPTATITNMRGERVCAGKQYFNAWRFNPETGDLISLSYDDKERFYNDL